MALDDLAAVPDDLGAVNLLASMPMMGDAEDEGAVDAAEPAMEETQLDKLRRWADPLATINLCDEIAGWPDGEGRLASIGMRVKEEYQIDVDSRAEWLATTRSALNLAMQVSQGKKTYPWDNASNVIYPLILTATIQFAARAYPAIVPGPKIVKGVVVGKDAGVPLIDPNSGQPIEDPNRPGEFLWAEKPGTKQARAERIGEHMSWQFLEEQEEWEDETDRLVHILPIAGCCFRKTYFDRSHNRNSSLLVLAQNLVINYRAKSMETAPRLTEELKLYPQEIEENIRSGVFVRHDVPLPQDGSADRDAPREYLEQHRWWDLDEDGYAEPYIVTVEKASGKVVRMVARYDAEGIILQGADKKVRQIKPVHYYTKYDFLPNPDGGIYGIGFGRLLNPINESINTTINLIFDAGHLATTGGGFIGKGMAMHSGTVRFQPGEYKPINVPGQTVRDSVVPLQFPGPSPVLFQLLGLLIEAGKEVSSNTEILAGNQRQANVPATTTLALIEQGLKVFTGIYKRIFRALKKEYAKAFRLNRLFLDKQSNYQFLDEWKVIEQQDYIRSGGVIPMSDPGMVEDMQKLARAEGLKEFANDRYVDGREVRRRILDAMKVEDIDKVLLPKPPPDPAAQAQAIEFALREVEIRAKALANMAAAVESLARADVMVDENMRGWLTVQLEGLRAEMEMLSNGGRSQAPGPDGGGLQALAAPPGNGAGAAVPA